MSLDTYFRTGETVDMGTHVFTAEEIVAFARRFDPQPFHMDAEAASKSVLGGLCASGWHTCAVWMRHYITSRAVDEARPWQGPGPRPEYGPSPGLTDLKWLKPVMVGSAITFTRRVVSHRPVASRPGWRMITMIGGAHDETGEAVMEFENAVLVRVE